MPQPIGYAPQSQFPIFGLDPDGIDPDSWYNAGTYGSENLTPEQMRERQASFWIPHIATGGYIPPDQDNLEAMAALGQTDAYNQRRQYLEQVGQQRLASLQDHQADSRGGGVAAQTFALAGMALPAAAAAAAGGAASGLTSHTGAATVAGSNTAAGAAGAGAGMGTMTGAVPAAVSGAAGAGGGALAGLTSMNPMVLSSLIGAGGSLLGGAIQGNAAGNAADLSREMYAENQRLQQPFVQAGYGANQSLAGLMGLTPEGSGELVRPFDAAMFEQYKDPGYDFRLQQGTQALRNAASAGSGALSGSAMKDLMMFGQDAASQEYGNAFNRYQTQQGNIFSRLSDIARVGQASATGVGAAGTQSAQTGGQAVMNQGSAYGGGVVGAGNAGGQGLVNHWLFNTPQGRAMWQGQG